MVFIKTKFDLNIFDKFDEKFALNSIEYYLCSSLILTNRKLSTKSNTENLDLFKRFNNLIANDSFDSL